MGSQKTANSKTSIPPKGREKNQLDMGLLNEIIEGIAPKHNSKLTFEIVFFVIVFLSISTQFLQIYKFVCYYLLMINL